MEIIAKWVEDFIMHGSGAQTKIITFLVKRSEIAKKNPQITPVIHPTQI